jgi:hypothetical protein
VVPRPAPPRDVAGVALPGARRRRQRRRHQEFIDDFFPNWNFIGNIPPSSRRSSTSSRRRRHPGVHRVHRDRFPGHALGALRDGLRRQLRRADRLLQHHAERQ